MLRVLTTLALLAIFSACSEFDQSAYLPLSEQYDVTIHRDIWGVPHVYGATDRDAAFGFAYAQAEDNWPTIEAGLPFYRGTLARMQGPDAAATDYLIKLLKIWPTLAEHYETDLSADVRDYIDGFVDGLNYYAAKHPDQVNADLLPVTAHDIVAANMLRHLLFYGFQNSVQELTGPERAREISRANSVALDGVPIGSNAFAVAPAYSTDGATRIAINSHQPTTGPVSWYEAHIKSATGLNVMGGLFPGSASINLGFTETVAWAATVNHPDLFDVYVLEIHPDDPYLYLLDGEWRPLERGTAEITVKLWGFLPWTVREETLYSEHGPVLRTDHGTYAFRYAGMGELRQVEQWYRLNQAKNLDEWREAMRMQSFASFNFVAADASGNVMFVHNSLTPQRAPGYDWSQYLPGDDSSLIWRDVVPFDELPQVVNPASGWVMSANQSPFRVTAEEDNPDPADFPASAGYQTRMTNRAHRGMELLDALGPISAAEFYAIKHDKSYSRASRSYVYITQALEIDYSDTPQLHAAQMILRDWDLATDIDSRGAALGVCLVSSEWSAEQRGDPAPSVGPQFETCVALLQEKFGRVDPEWGSVNRHIRGTVNLPVAGGPDILRAIYGSGLEENGYLTNVAGDGLYYLVSWDAQRRQSVQGIHHFGSATLDEASPHFADQAPLFAREELRDPLFTENKLMANLSRSYKP